jgi:protocatechuate 3,4-dioxygenase beta subunit
LIETASSAAFSDVPPSIYGNSGTPAAGQAGLSGPTEPNSHIVATAQDYSSGTLTGTVVDTAGAPVAGASITVKSLRQGFERILTTDYDGQFRFLLIPTGAYAVTINKSGYQIGGDGHVTVGPGRSSSYTFTVLTESEEAAEVLVTGTTQSSRPKARDQPPTAPVPPENIYELVKRSEGVTRALPVIYKTPSDLPFDEPSTFRLVIAGRDYETAKSSVGIATGRLREARVSVTNRVRATLDGDARFVDIVAVTPAEQAVTEAGNTIWEWRVTPRRPGKVTMTYHVYNIAKADGEKAEVQWAVYEDSFEVTLTPVQRIQLWFEGVNKAWLWLVGFVPAAMGAWAWLRARTRRNQPAAAG